MSTSNLITKKIETMKNTKYIYFLVFFLTGLLVIPSCQKNLDVAPGSPLESNYFDNESKIQAGIAAVYAKELDLRGPWIDRGGPFIPAYTLPGDDITYFDASSEFETFSGLNASNERLGIIWNLRYQLIARANFMFDKIADSTIAALYKTPNLKDYNKGELLFLRSYENFMLWDWFRKAPIQVERIVGTGSEMYLEPATDLELLDQAISDLEKAASLLPQSWPENEVGRITQDGANGLLVKCYVERACYNNKNAGDYGKAITSFGKISSGRTIVGIPYGDNFDYRTENNAESLFEVQATQITGASNNAWLTNDTDGQNHSTGAFGGLFWNDDWYTYSSGTGGPTDKLINSFQEGDPRISETMINEGWGHFSGWKMVKYVNGDRGDAYGSWGANTYNNPRVLRLADVKLLAAEAYMATGNSTEALKQVNDVRTRARKSINPASTVPVDYSSIDMSKIMNERFLELAGEEGIRWTDLRRWHAAGYINLSNWTPADFGFPGKYDPALFAFDVTKHLLFPIPQAEMDANPKMAASGNNPGY
jgi:hypothetical protein